jgi:hypothetical protein
MLSAVQFDNHARVDAREVHDVAADRQLPSKLLAVEPTVSQEVPELRFSVCGTLTQPSGSLKRGLRIAFGRHPRSMVACAFDRVRTYA